MEENKLGPLIKELSERIKIQADADLKSHHLTFAQSRVIVFLMSKEGFRSTQKEIEDELKVSHPTVVGIISRMERGGFVTTWQDKVDKRNKIVSLTEYARGIDTDMKAMMVRHEAQLIKGLSEYEVLELMRMLKIVTGNARGSRHFVKKRIEL